MEFKEKLENLKNAVIVLEEAKSLPEEFDVAVAAKESTAYDKGFMEGKASVGEPGDKIYSQEELNVALENAAQESQVKLDQAVQSAKSELILEIEADLQAAQDSENVTEQEFKAKLESRKSVF